VRNAKLLRHLIEMNASDQQSPHDDDLTSIQFRKPMKLTSWCPANTPSTFLSHVCVVVGSGP
jgi:hypothetical protein